jgi:tetratricopeptide (TPR) repeat protein
MDRGVIKQIGVFTGAAMLGCMLTTMAASILPLEAQCGVGFCRCCGEAKCTCQAVCECEEKSKQLWEDYKRHVKVVVELYDNAFKNGDEALERFSEDMDDIIKEMRGPVTSIYPKVATGGVDLAELSAEEVKLATEEVARRSEAVEKGLRKAPEAAAPVAVGAEVIATLIELSLYSKEVYDTSNNLDYAIAAQEKQFDQAHEKWEQALKDLQEALEKDKECDELKRSLEVKLKAEEKLEKHARLYVQMLGRINRDGSVTEVYYVAGKEFKNAEEALEAAKTLLQQRNRSGSSDLQRVLWLTSTKTDQPAVKSSETYEVSRETAKEVIRQLTIAEMHLKQGARLLRDRLKQYGKAHKNLRLVQSRIGTGR